MQDLVLVETKYMNQVKSTAVIHKEKLRRKTLHISTIHEK